MQQARLGWSMPGMDVGWMGYRSRNVCVPFCPVVLVCGGCMSVLFVYQAQSAFDPLPPQQLAAAVVTCYDGFLSPLCRPCGSSQLP